MGLLLSGKNPAALKTAERQTFTATAGQTTFTVTSGYNVGDIDVYLNGLKLVDADDYYASNGTTIVLTSAASAGDSLSVTFYNNFLAANTYTKVESDSRYIGTTSTTPMQTYLRTPNYGISSYSDSAFASLEASVGQGTNGVGIKAWGRSISGSGGELTYVTDTRGASGQHIFYGWNGSGLTQFMKIDSSGRMVVPNQPLWVARQTQTNGVATGSATKMTWWDVLYNIGGNWNTSNHRFTAPTTGVYQVTMQGIKYPMSGALHIDIWKNGSVQSQYRARAEEASGYNQYSVTCFIQLNLNDYIEFYFFGDGGLHGDHGTFSIRLAQ